MCLDCKVSHPLLCYVVVFDDRGQSDIVDGDAGAPDLHLYFCLGHQTVCTYNTRTQQYELV